MASMRRHNIYQECLAKLYKQFIFTFIDIVNSSFIFVAISSSSIYTPPFSHAYKKDTAATVSSGASP